MNGILNFLNMLNDNWTLILAAAAALFGIAAKTHKWVRMGEEEKRKAAIEAVRKSMLAMVTEAEQKYGSGTGTVKRSDVLKEIFEQYPVLAQAIHIDGTTELLDSMIDTALKDLRKLLEDNNEFNAIINGLIVEVKEHE